MRILAWLFVIVAISLSIFTIGFVLAAAIAESRRKRAEEGDAEEEPSERAGAKPASGAMVSLITNTEFPAANEAKLSATVLCGMPGNWGEAGEPLGYLVYGKETCGGLPECGFLPIPSERTRNDR